MTKEKAVGLLNKYGKAWVEQDVDLLLSIFTQDAIYNDPHEPVCRGKDEIRDYWIRKVVRDQKDIRFDLKNVWIDGDIIAEWHAEFIDISRNIKIEIEEVAVFTTEGDLFSSLREYYKSKKTPHNEN